MSKNILSGLATAEDLSDLALPIGDDNQKYVSLSLRSFTIYVFLTIFESY